MTASRSISNFFSSFLPTYYLHGSHQPWHVLGCWLVILESLGHITYWKIKKKTKNKSFYVFISGCELFDNFHMIACSHGCLRARTVAVVINYLYDQLLEQETIFRLKPAAIESSNHTPCKMAKNATFWEIHNHSVNVSTCREIMQYDVCWSW